MSKKKIVIILAILLVLIGIIVGVMVNKNKATDAYRFSQEYKEIDADNVFVYRDIDEIIKILENGTGVVYLGFPECKWCQRYVTYLNEVAQYEGIEKIYYYNIKEDRANNTAKYQKIVSILGDNLANDEEGNARIFVPDVTFVNKGEIVGHDNETSMESGEPDEYWSEEKVMDLKGRLSGYMQAVNANICNEGCNE